MILSPTRIVPLLLLTLLTGCAVSDRQVIEQADQAHDGLKPAVITDAELSECIQRVGDRIVEAARVADKEKIGPAAHFNDEEREWMFSHRMQFHFVNSKTLNAFTTGGEHMYIYTELFEQCKTEDELAAVMSHEFAHVYCRHVQHGMNNQLALTAGLSVCRGGRVQSSAKASAVQPVCGRSFSCPT